MKRLFVILAAALLLVAMPSKSDAQTIRDKYGAAVGKIETKILQILHVFILLSMTGHGE